MQAYYVTSTTIIYTIDLFDNDKHCVGGWVDECNFATTAFPINNLLKYGAVIYCL